MSQARVACRVVCVMGALLLGASWRLLPCGHAATVTKALTPPSGIVGGSRFKDIDSDSYKPAFSSSYDYGNATCTIEYEANDPANLTGTLTATGLKPNFAYQIKLEGRPSGLWGSDGDDETNTRIGYMGRWWCVQCNWNVNDSELNGHLTQGHTVIGYLLFDYFVTDGWGAASYAFVADNSLHVLWKTSQRTPTSNDTSPTSHTVDAHAAYGYTHDYTGSTVWLYGEWEPGRPLPGAVVMDAGIYDCRMLLTEEDFHETMTWTTVLTNDYVNFVIGSPAAIYVADFLVRELGPGRRLVSWQAGPSAVAEYRLHRVGPGGRSAVCATVGGEGARVGGYQVVDSGGSATYALEIVDPNGRSQWAEPQWADARWQPRGGLSPGAHRPLRRAAP